MAGLSGVPPEILLALWTAFVGFVTWLAQTLFRAWRAEAGQETQVHLQGWAEVKERDKQIDLLRRMLDRSRRRENAYATALELALLAMKLPEDEQAPVMARTMEILAAALPHADPGS